MTSGIRILLSLAVAITLAGCASEPQVRSPTPPPPKTQAPEPPPIQSTEQSPQPTASAQAKSGSSSGQHQQPNPSPTESSEFSEPPPPASSDSADVEITDIPVDENGNPIVSAATTDETQAPSSNAQARNGGGTTPPDNNDGATGGGANVSAASMVGEDGAPVVNIGASTTQERAEQLDQNLDAKLAEFDELMRRAREDAEREQSKTNGRGSLAGVSQAAQGSRTKPSDGRGAGGQADTSSGLGHTPDLVGSDQAGSAHRPASPIPGDIPLARDDDIVARQLREAATREADPQLREKLWEEYRKYTRGSKR